MIRANVKRQPAEAPRSHVRLRRSPTRNDTYDPGRSHPLSAISAKIQRGGDGAPARSESRTGAAVGLIRGMQRCVSGSAEGILRTARPELRARVTSAACLWALLAAGGLPGNAEAGDPSDGMAFIRVVGDLRAEFIGIWRQPIERENVEVATGSGFVIAPSGLILTNHHVVDDAPYVATFAGKEAEVTIENRRIEVFLGGGGLGVLEGYVVASDPELDLAVLQVTAADLAYLPFGDSDALEAGSRVRVLGFPFGRQVEVGRRTSPGVAPGVTVTSGSLSAARADDAGGTRYLQTDASVNPGSSGGPMIDEDGYAVAVIRMKRARDATSHGAGFRGADQSRQGLPGGSRPAGAAPGGTAVPGCRALARLEAGPGRAAGRLRGHVAGEAPRGHRGVRGGRLAAAGSPGHSLGFEGARGGAAAGAGLAGLRTRASERASAVQGGPAAVSWARRWERIGTVARSASSSGFSIWVPRRSWPATWAPPRTWRST